jgi:hypothetical protein
MAATEEGKHRRGPGGVEGHRRATRTFFDLGDADFVDQFSYKPGEIPNSPCCDAEMSRCPDKDGQHYVYEFPKIKITEKHRTVQRLQMR